ncbi:monooxygenase [Xylographa bjoerkii]|nr:monooxygenase [Xylographa bjoerkii]
MTEVCSWCLERWYPTFWTQIGLGMAEFSDLPMTRPAETLHDLYDAKYVGEYLEKYIEEFKYEGHTLRDRIYFGVSVTKVEKKDATWAVHVYCDHTKTASVFYATKLMIASGLTSTPNMPDLPNQDCFKGDILHQRSFGQSSVLASPSKNVTVLGGAKSAADMVYASVKAGKSVSWIIRSSGSGPAAFLSSEGRGPYKNSAELGFTHIMSTFTPSYYTPRNWWTRFLHRTSLGGWTKDLIWKTADKVSRTGADFDGRVNARESFKKLKPSTTVFWSNDTLGLIQHPEFWQTIAENVDVYREDILELDNHIVRLKSRVEVPTDVLLCGTGWNPSAFDFFSDAQMAELGLPHSIDQATTNDLVWSKLQTEADHQVLAQFPGLASPPDYYKKPTSLTPYRLYNSMASLNDDSIVILGYIFVPNSFRAAEVQAIWATAYLDKQIVLPSAMEMQAQIALLNAWCKRRYLNNGDGGNYLHYDLIGYTDTLLRQLGLSYHYDGWWKYLFTTRTAIDFKLPWQQYLAKTARKTV